MFGNMLKQAFKNIPTVLRDEPFPGNTIQDYIAEGSQGGHLLPAALGVGVGSTLGGIGLRKLFNLPVGIGIGALLGGAAGGVLGNMRLNSEREALRQQARDHLIASGVGFGEGMWNDPATIAYRKAMIDLTGDSGYSTIARARIPHPDIKGAVWMPSQYGVNPSSMARAIKSGKEMAMDEFDNGFID